MENNIPIGRINSVDIFAVSTENGEILVPIKPICTALQIDDKAQRSKIQDDDILCSTGMLSTSVADDGKQREMFCLPLKFVYGWLFTINTKNVATEAKESVRK